MSTPTPAPPMPERAARILERLSQRGIEDALAMRALAVSASTPEPDGVVADDATDDGTS